jgi:phenylalanyl-tRNA synthetase beta chain
MKYISPLIKKYISVNDTPENIANNLILKTVEIEEIIKREIPNSIVIGKILKAEPHPDSDHMNVCQVDCGNKGQFQIVCGAQNVADGLLVPVALEGTVFEKA